MEYEAAIAFRLPDIQCDLQGFAPRLETESAALRVDESLQDFSQRSSSTSAKKRAGQLQDLIGPAQLPTYFEAHSELHAVARGSTIGTMEASDRASAKRGVRGWVYVISNPSVPQLIKVGFSLKDPSLRAQELGGTGLPHPYQVDYEALVTNPREVEQKAHKHLLEYREAKEWFRCSQATAVAAIKAVLDEPVLLENNLFPQGSEAPVGLFNVSRPAPGVLVHRARQDPQAPNLAAIQAEAAAPRRLSRSPERLMHPSATLAVLIGTAPVTPSQAHEKVLAYARKNHRLGHETLHCANDLQLLGVFRKPFVKEVEIGQLLRPHLSPA